jgi:hypothetical protein
MTMTQTFASVAAKLKSSGSITDADTLALRQLVWSDSLLQPDEADALFDLNTSCADRSAAWVDFFVDALCHYVVHQCDPKGYVSDSNAAWLMAHIDHDGVVDSFVELDLLVRILETASNTPESLQAYVLAQIEQTVLHGTGPTRLHGDIQPGRIDAAEVALLRRILFARGGEQNTVISATEAELLFRLKDATLSSDNAPEWKTLFVQCIANHLMAHQMHSAVSHDEQKRREAWVSNTGSGMGGFLDKMLSLESLAEGIRAVRQWLTPAADEKLIHDVAVESSRAITAEEAAWLKAKISVDDHLDDLEKSLLAFIVEEEVDLPEALADLQKSA